MKQIAETILSENTLNHPTDWALDEGYDALFNYVYREDVWDGDFREKIAEVREKDVSTLSYDEIRTYLTFIFCMERTNDGCVEGHIRNGILPALMKRYLELEGEQ